jgi:hypothetical protein
MAEQDVDPRRFDLPNTAPVTHKSEVEHDEHRWQLLQTLAVLLMAYATLHKLLMPIFLKTTRLSQSHLAEIDYFFILNGLFAWWIIQKRTLGRVGSLMTGALIGLAVAELLRISQGAYFGWLLFSHSLSSVPQAAVSIALLTRSDRDRRLPWAWGGATLIVLFFVFSGHGLQVAQSPSVALDSKRLQSVPAVESSPLGCGLSEVHVGAQALSTLQIWRGPLTLDSCGFWPAVARIEALPRKIWLENKTAKALNFHFLIHNQGKHRLGWNVLVAAGQKMMSPVMSLNDQSVGLLFSDGDASQGLIVILPVAHQKAFLASRRPLDFSEVQAP